MKDLLLSELNSSRINLMQAANLVEQSLFGLDVNTAKTSMQDIAAFINVFQQQLEDIDDALERAERLLELIFVEQLFVDNERPFWPLSTHLVNDGLAYRAIAPALKNLFLIQVIEACGFGVEAVYVPDEVMLRIICDDDFAIIFSPIDGKPINWYDLESRLSQESDSSEYVTLNGLTEKDLIVRYLVSMKTALIREKKFTEALQCVDLILSLTPEDPYHRRDRGFLLQQLDCFKVAFDDYKFYVEQCPKDPEAKLLQMQLDMISQADTVIH